MASTSSSSSAAVISFEANRTMYDVFLSFRGEDTRNSFTDHLYKALRRAAVETFRDNDAIGRGEDLKPEIDKAIKASRASIVVLSETYAKSRWCLNELVLILEQRKTVNHFVLPVFYHIDPSDVRNQQTSFAIEVDDKKWTEDNVSRWKAALTEVANLTGMVLNGPETNFITEIVNTIKSKLDLKLVSTPAHLTGIDARAEDINSWLNHEKSGPQVLVIWGMGGSGKTTLVKYVYNSNSQNFESSSYLEEIGVHCEQPHGLLELQKQLLRDILEETNKSVSNVSEGTSKIEAVLQMKKAFIVLDDIGKQDELVALLGSRVFHTQSKIIVTTRDQDVCAWFKTTRYWVYGSKLMNNHESLELLSWHAFGSKIPMEGFKELAVQVANYCEGNPLALKVLGCSLVVSAEDPREKNIILDCWRDMLNLLKTDVHSGIQAILRRSLYSLPFDSQRELFLHIACFFVGDSVDFVMRLEPFGFSKAGIMALANKCLLEVSPSNKLMMHQLLQEMGRKIVDDESPKDPAKRSRVWRDKESYDVLRKGEGSETIEVLALDMQKVDEGMRSKPFAFKTDSLAKMEKLKYLNLVNVQFTGSYKKLPELRCLYWQGFHLKFLPSNLFTRSLVVLIMVNSKLEQFEPPTVLESLKFLNFYGSDKLISIRNLCRVPNLETLVLYNCSSLTHVCKSIGGLKRLETIDLTGCTNLWKVSSIKNFVNRLKGLKASFVGEGNQQQLLFSLPHSLHKFYAFNCNLGQKDDISVVFDGLPYHVNLGGNLYESLPDYMDLTRLRVLRLTCCPRLKSLLCLPSTLEALYTDGCVSLEKITFQSARFRLREFGYEGCFNLSDVQGLFRLVSIAKLDEIDLGHMKWLKAYQDHQVYLTDDVITNGRICYIQMLYEYGIRSTFLSGIKDREMMSSYMSPSPFLSFFVPLFLERRRIEGLQVTFSYTLSDMNENMAILFAKISNTTKGRTWIYNPVVFCEPRVGEEAIWLSYWPIGDLIDTGDEINVSIIVGNAWKVGGCGANIVYIDGEVEKENLENIMKCEEVIGGDLSEFELTTGGYYLCRRDFFKQTMVSTDRKTPEWFKILFDDTIHYTGIKEWKKSCQTPPQLENGSTEWTNFRAGISGSLWKIVLRLDILEQTEKRKVLRAVCKIKDVDSIAMDMRNQKLTVIGEVDAVCLVSLVRKYVYAEIVSIKPAKEQLKRNP